ncbi:MAG: alcohol dehydrogenase catalytic domain-containing protein [Microthrixaceae bacterium]
MRAMLLETPGEPLVERELPDPVATTPYESVIDVLGCGVCHSDLHVAAGDFGKSPLVLGHEVVGHDKELGPVMVYAPWGCRRPECLPCSSGQEMICPDSHEAGIWEDGGYADKMLVRQRDYLLPLGDDVDPLELAPLACGGLTAFRAVRRAISLRPPGRTTNALVIGAGGLGQYAVQLLARDGAHVTVADTLPARRETALELGASASVDLEDADNESFDAIIDFVGAEATLPRATQLVRRGGVVVLVGMFGGTAPFGLGRQPSEAWLTTSIWGSTEDLRALLELNRREPLRHIVDHMPLTEANQAHDLLRSGLSRGRIVLHA